MLFNSIEFAAFLPIIFLLYWSIGSEKIRIQNIFLLAASYFFYGWWDWRFLSLIVMSSFVDFVLGQAIFNEENKKKRVFYLSLSLLDLLAFEKTQKSRFFVKKSYVIFSRNYKRASI
jgi:D-alanyl-lipoteichoic acid acyltransferase DltB (MBOAT superfamily)